MQFITNKQMSTVSALSTIIFQITKIRFCHLEVLFNLLDYRITHSIFPYQFPNAKIYKTARWLFAVVHHSENRTAERIETYFWIFLSIWNSRFLKLSNVIADCFEFSLLRQEVDKFRPGKEMNDYSVPSSTIRTYNCCCTIVEKIIWETLRIRLHSVISPASACSKIISADASSFSAAKSSAFFASWYIWARANSQW